MYALRTEYVRALCRRGDIRALKIGREYRISQASLDLFEREREAVA